MSRINDSGVPAAAVAASEIPADVEGASIHPVNISTVNRCA